MRQIYLIVSAIILAGSTLSGQTITPEVITSVGATMSNGNTNLNFTVGEITVNTISDGTYTIGQGFISRNTQMTISAVKSPTANLLNVSVYPNPTTEIVFVDVNAENLVEFRLVVYSVDGALVTKDNFTLQNSHIGINTQLWCKGTYILSLLDKENQILCSYQLIKL